MIWPFRKYAIKDKTGMLQRSKLVLHKFHNKKYVLMQLEDIRKEFLLQMQKTATSSLKKLEIHEDRVLLLVQGMKFFLECLLGFSL